MKASGIQAPEDSKSAAAGVAPLEEWLQMRSRCHHDWLQKDLLIKLRNLQQRGAFGNPGDTLKSLHWKKNYEELEELVLGMVRAFSPVQLFDSTALSSAPPWVRTWLRELLEILYLERGEITRLSEETYAALKRADAGYRRFMAETSGSRLDEFQHAVMELSRQLSALPQEIEIG